ncbi:MAG: tetratricopeptide repeat protein [Anaerolineales bacterium]
MQLHRNRFQPTSDPPHLTVKKTAAYAALILLGLGLVRLFELNYVRSPFAAPSIPTRSAVSWAEEGKSFFDAGNLNKAILAYQQAVVIDPKNAQLWTELSRIQTYSSTLLLSIADKQQRMQQAQDSINKALVLDPESAQGFAIKTLVLDWTASNPPDEATRQQNLIDAYQASGNALIRDPQNALALAFRAEVLADQSNWSTALDVGAQAAGLGKDIMDVHRAYAYVLESNADYPGAIDEYKKAIKINPNLPFLHMSLGVNYRKMGEIATNQQTSQDMIDSAINEFAIAASLNDKDPGPYLSIAQTYANRGDFFAAELNAEKALTLDNTNPIVYGRLGVIYYHAKNYETAIKVLKCAVRGCLAADNEEQSVDVAGTSLSANTLDIYYTYGSVKAFYGNEPGNCTEARSIFSQLRASPWYDSTVEGIIREGEVICAKFENQTTPP